MSLLSWLCGDFVSYVSSQAGGGIMHHNWSSVAELRLLAGRYTGSVVANMQLPQPLLLELLDAHTPNALAVLLLAVLLVLTIYKIAFAPLNRVRGVADVGWGFLDSTVGESWLSLPWMGSRRVRVSGKKLAERIRRQQRLRKSGNLPPVYPNGWFAVAETRDLAKRQVRSVQVLGHSLAVFRGTSGEVRAVDAYCPHLGANMSVGGVVKGDCIECPFHGWQFSGEDGSCTSIPYTKKVPDVAKVRHWDTQEVNGFVFVWHDAEGRSPHWRVPEVEPVSSGYWSYRGRTEHEVLAHVQEIPENGADIAHLGHLHVPSVFKGADLSKVFASNKILDVAQHEWQGTWQPLEGASSHLATVNIDHAFAIKHGVIKLFKMAVEARQIGPGLVHLHLSTSLGKGVLVQTVTPLGPLRQRITHHLYTAPSFIAPFAKFVLHSEACHVERDIMIWNSKQYLNRPLLVVEDKLIKKFRTWYQQFYSENSPTINTVDKMDLDW